MIDKFFKFYPCNVCRAMVSGPHACSPLALGQVKFHPDIDLSRFNQTQPSRQLTEERVRAIVREELAKLMAGNR